VPRLRGQALQQRCHGGRVARLFGLFLHLLVFLFLGLFLFFLLLFGFLLRYFFYFFL
jgi:hypothetical protein